MNISHELFGLWAVHSGLVLVKTMGMSLWTAKRRVATQTFANPEDTKGPVANNESKVDRANPEVERVRRCHGNFVSEKSKVAISKWGQKLYFILSVNNRSYTRYTYFVCSQ